jgi:quercetin 2,3-dioxygenase
MMKQSPARIFLANEHKLSFDIIEVINDEILDGGCNKNFEIGQSSYLLLIPVIGAIRYKDSRGNENLLAAGQWQLTKMQPGEKIEIQNPFKEAMVNYLQIWVKGDERLLLSLPLSQDYDVNGNMSRLVRLFPVKFKEENLPFILSIGKFHGRGDTTYNLDDNTAGLFLFVIEGAFEAEGRLLHARDGLGLWGIKQVELEALSNDAIIVSIELLRQSN